MNLPNVGQKCFIRVNGKPVNGTCVSNECRIAHGPHKGQAIPGLGKMEDAEGNRYWLTPNTWEFGHG